jgi:hypothetical protein
VYALNVAPIDGSQGPAGGAGLAAAHHAGRADRVHLLRVRRRKIWRAHLVEHAAGGGGRPGCGAPRYLGACSCWAPSFPETVRRRKSVLEPSVFVLLSSLSLLISFSVFLFLLPKNGLLVCSTYSQEWYGTCIVMMRRKCRGGRPGLRSIAPLGARGRRGPSFTEAARRGHVHFAFFWGCSFSFPLDGHRVG